MLVKMFEFARKLIFKKIYNLILNLFVYLGRRVTFIQHFNRRCYISDCKQNNKQETINSQSLSI